MIPGVDEHVQELWAEIIEATDRGDHQAADRAREDLARLQATQPVSWVRATPVKMTRVVR